jgi:hypothetical protein
VPVETFPNPIFKATGRECNFITWGQLTLSPEEFANLSAADERQITITQNFQANNSLDIMYIGSDGNLYTEEEASSLPLLDHCIVTLTSNLGYSNTQEFWGNGTSNVSASSGMAETITCVNHTLGIDYTLVLDSTGVVVETTYNYDGGNVTILGIAVQYTAEKPDQDPIWDYWWQRYATDTANLTFSSSWGTTTSS